ncbi:hypothetical protein BDW22DRAFT_1353070 [Trametopsis cervina]|nr:hypothetical protein BDW22DRAFT_1353070 [Trametopsis cervina]
MSQSVSSFSDVNESTISLTTNPNDSTVALIPKATTPSKPVDAQSSSAGGTTTVATSNVQPRPPVKDWEAAFGQLATSIGFAGAVPQLPKHRKKQSENKKSKGKTSASSSSRATQETKDTPGPSQQGGKTKS